jgi:hypothetical protein
MLMRRLAALALIETPHPVRWCGPTSPPRGEVGDEAPARARTRAGAMGAHRSETCATRNTHKMCPALVPVAVLRRDPAWLCGGGMVIAASGRGRGAGAQRGVGRTGRRWVATLPCRSGVAHLKCARADREGFLPRRPPSSECFAAMRRRRPPVTLPMSVWRGRGVGAAGVRALVGGVVGAGRGISDGEGGKKSGGVGRSRCVRAVVVRAGAGDPALRGGTVQASALCNG